MGSTPARDAVVSAYAQSLIKYKARQLSRKPEFRPSEADDLAQDLLVHLLTQAHQFDPERASPNTFTGVVVEKAAAMLVRARRRKKRGGGIQPVSLEAPVGAGDETTLAEQLSPLDLARRLGLFPDESIPRDEINSIIAGLPPDLQAVCCELQAGNISSAARSLGKSRRQVRNAIDRIRRSFEAQGFKDS
jgi:RNA polymerase sigma-70 factor (ECF subfamily)